MATIPTVRIKHDGFPGGVLINADRFDPKIHKKFDDDKPAAKAEPKPEPKAESKPDEGDKPDTGKRARR